MFFGAFPLLNKKLFNRKEKTNEIAWKEYIALGKKMKWQYAIIIEEYI